MSPLWRDEVGLYVGPRRIVLVRMQRGLQPVRVAESAASRDPGPVNDWDAVQRALDAQLAQPAWLDAVVRVVLSDQWARYAIVPWSGALRNESERLCHARQVLADVYGESSGQWALSMSLYSHAEARVVSAVPTGLLTALRTALDTRGLRPVSIQPRLVAVYNGWRRRLPDAGCWFACVDDEVLSLAHVGESGWDEVHSVRVRGDWIREVDRLRTLRRLGRGDRESEPIYIHAPAARRGRTAACEGRDVEWLDSDADAAVAPDGLGMLGGLYQ